MARLASWLRSSAQRQTALTLAILSILFGINVAYVFSFLSTSASDGAVVDLAGRQRMLSQKLSREAFAVASGDEGSRAALTATAAEFEQNLMDLLDGNSTRGVSAAPDSVAEELESVRDLWESFAARVDLLARGASTNPAFKEALEYILDHNLDLLAAMEQTVVLLTGQPAPSPSAIDVAGRQRMLSQKLSKEAFAISNGDVASREALQATAEEIDLTLIDLLSGNTARSVPPATGAVAAQLLEVRELWAPFQVAATSVANEPVIAPEFEEALAYIGENNLELLRRSDVAVASYTASFASKITNLRRMVIGFGFAALLISIVAWLSVRRVERELQRLNGELAARAEERQSLVHQILFAQEDERRSVAHEIHDGPAQQLAAARMLVDAFEAGIELDPESSSADYLDRAKRYLDLSLVETRRIISGLRPAPLDDLGLAAALHELLTDLTAPTEMDFSLGSAELDGQLSPAAETALYRVAQEAANNALKHSGGTHLSVSLRSERSLAHLRVQDDGAGFDLSELEQPNGERFGLIGMRERIELLDGELGIQSSSTGGTLVTATLPLSDVG